MQTFFFRVRKNLYIYIEYRIGRDGWMDGWMDGLDWMKIVPVDLDKFLDQR